MTTLQATPPTEQLVMELGLVLTTLFFIKTFKMLFAVFANEAIMSGSKNTFGTAIINIKINKIFEMAKLRVLFFIGWFTRFTGHSFTCSIGWMTGKKC